MRAGSNDAKVIRVLIQDKTVHQCEPIEVFRGAGVQFDIRADINFASLPAFDRDGPGRRADDRHRASISEAVSLVPLCRARQ